MNAGGRWSNRNLCAHADAQLRAVSGTCNFDADRHAADRSSTHLPVAVSRVSPDKAEPVAGESESTTLSR